MTRLLELPDLSTIVGPAVIVGLAVLAVVVLLLVASERGRL